MNWQHLDTQMRTYSTRLTSEVKLTPEMAQKLATTIAADVRFLSFEQKAEIRVASPVPVQDRLAELKAFQGWMDQASTVRSNPFVTRAQVLSQNYICFVYLPEACFRVLSKVCPSGSAAKKCAQFLSNNPVRAFRNAVAHSNWTYRSDLGPSSIGHARVAIQAKRFNSSRLNKMTFRFGSFFLIGESKVHLLQASYGWDHATRFDFILFGKFKYGFFSVLIGSQPKCI